MAFASDRQSNVTLISLPPEIFVRCQPADLAALRRTHRKLNVHLQDAPHLWKQVFHQLWDPYTPTVFDTIVIAATPPTKSVTRTADWHESHSSSSLPCTGHFDYAQQVQRRTWAERQISRLRRRPIDTFANYNETLRALLSIARSRQARSAVEAQIVTFEPKESADYLINLLTGPSSMQNFRQLVYPRPDVKQLLEWQAKQIQERNGKQAVQLHAQRRKDEKRARSSSSVSGSPSKAKRSRTSASIAGPTESASSSSVSAEANVESIQSPRLVSPVRRRSARVQLHAYPTELHHLLYDKRTQNLITLDDGTGVANLEALDLLDEQAAAELHVLHGIHPGFREKPTATAESSRAERQLQQALEDSEEEDSDFVDAGTPTDPHFSDIDDEMSGTHRTDESEDDDVDENVFRFFVDQLDLRRHYREPALGTDLGHEISTRLRGRAREIVYDTAHFGPENSYGPLRAWRERYLPLDGTGFQAVDEALDVTSEDDSDASNDTVVARTGGDGDESSEDSTDDDEQASEESDSDHSSTGQRSDGEVIDLADEDEAEGLARIVAPLLPETSDTSDGDNSDVDSETDEEFEEDSDGESSVSNFLWQLREAAIAHSRGLAPYHESKRLKAAAQKQTKPSGPIDIWRTDKRVDWVIVEAIMVVMYCNIRHAVLSHGWGLSFRLPRSNRSLNGHDQYARLVNGENAATQAGAWRDMVGLPCGWSHSRGTADDRDQAGLSSPTESGKPYDWAGVESTWIGTYAFLDWSKWASFNARDPISRGFPDRDGNTIGPNADPLDQPIMAQFASTPNLESEREALGDCLQLRMELLPLSQQRPRNENERILSFLEGNDTECIDESTLEDVEAGKSTCQLEQRAGQYPPLRFHGHTRTYLDDGPPVPRGELYGTVRPVFAEQDEGEKSKPRAIVAIHWDITHRYDGEDAWSLSGVQAGPPGTRAPIYGTWGAAARRDNLSPCGPFTYYKTSERPWKEVEEELQSEQQSRTRTAATTI